MTRIGLDIAKNVFQVHGVDVHGKVVERTQLSGSKGRSFFAHLTACRIGLEACGTVRITGEGSCRSWVMPYG